MTHLEQKITVVAKSNNYKINKTDLYEIAATICKVNRGCSINIIKKEVKYYFNN